MSLKLPLRTRRTAMALMLLLAGCAQTAEQQAAQEAGLRVRADPALFKQEPTAPAPRLPLTLVLLVSPDMPGAAAPLPLAPGGWLFNKRTDGPTHQLQTSSIVEQALLKSLSAGLQGSVESRSSLPPPSEKVDATLEIVAVRFDYDEYLQVLIPFYVPILGFGAFGKFDASTRLSVQLRLFDGQGRQVWTRDYDDGPRSGVWGYPLDHAWLAGINQAAHDAA